MAGVNKKQFYHLIKRSESNITRLFFIVNVNVIYKNACQCNFKLIMICEILHQVCSVNLPECILQPSFITLVISILSQNIISPSIATTSSLFVCILQFVQCARFAGVHVISGTVPPKEKSQVLYSNQVILGQLIGCPQNVKLLLLRNIFVARGRRMQPWTCRTYIG